MSTRRKDDGIRRGFPRPIRTRELLQFWEAGVFREAWDDLNLNSDDLLDLQMEIILNPRAAPIIAGLAASERCGLLRNPGGAARAGHCGCATCISRGMEKYCCCWSIPKARRIR